MVKYMQNAHGVPNDGYYYQEEDPQYQELKQRFQLGKIGKKPRPDPKPAELKAARDEAGGGVGARDDAPQNRGGVTRREQEQENISFQSNMSRREPLAGRDEPPAGRAASRSSRQLVATAGEFGRSTRATASVMFSRAPSSTGARASPESVFSEFRSK